MERQYGNPSEYGQGLEYAQQQMMVSGFRGWLGSCCRVGSSE